MRSVEVSGDHPGEVAEDDVGWAGPAGAVLVVVAGPAQGDGGSGSLPAALTRRVSLPYPPWTYASPEPTLTIIMRG